MSRYPHYSRITFGYVRQTTYKQVSFEESLYQSEYVEHAKYIMNTQPGHRTLFKKHKSVLVMGFMGF